MIIQDADSVEILAKAFSQANQFLNLIHKNHKAERPLLKNDDPHEIRLDDDHAIYMDWQYWTTGLCVSFDGELPPSYSCGISRPTTKEEYERQCEEDGDSPWSVEFDLDDGIPDKIRLFLQKKV